MSAFNPQFKYEKICLTNGLPTWYWHLCLRDEKKISVSKKFALYKKEELFVSIISIAELEYGVIKSEKIEKNSASLKGLIAMVNVIGFDIHAASQYAYIRLSLERKGTPIGSNDMLIAAIAKSLDYTLVTNNEREFSRVEGLKIENWTKN